MDSLNLEEVVFTNCLGRTGYVWLRRFNPEEYCQEMVTAIHLDCRRVRLGDIELENLSPAWEIFEGLVPVTPTACSPSLM